MSTQKRKLHDKIPFSHYTITTSDIINCNQFSLKMSFSLNQTAIKHRIPFLLFFFFFLMTQVILILRIIFDCGKIIYPHHRKQEPKKYKIETYPFPGNLHHSLLCSQNCCLMKEYGLKKKTHWKGQIFALMRTTI